MRSFHSKKELKAEHTALTKASITAESLMALEKKKIKDAIRTDFVLSIEIVLIALGVLADQPLLKMAISLSLVALVITLGVYAIVAMIVRMDDVGFALSKMKKQSLQKMGQAILWVAPKMLRVLAVLGAVAMLLVGGELLVHALEVKANIHMPTLIYPPLFATFVGFLAGLVVVGVTHLFEKLKG